ncbi:MAG TPA: hypothetical protein VE713_01545, partial [Pyrinomonadaceae bacterium]|nr:hypothetical protein [Pyrinomonadaceae bacterium]
IAVVEQKNGKRLVLRVSKHGTEVPIKKMSDEEAKPYLKFLDLIREEIYEDGTKQLKDDYDFVNIYHAHFGLLQGHISVPPPGPQPPGASGNGCDKPSAQAEGEAFAYVGSEALEGSHAGAAEEDRMYHGFTIAPPDSTDGIEPP